MSRTQTQPSMRTAARIRQQFIDFFVKRHGHTFVPSSPVVPHDDPTLLFANAGMNQFKPIFLGQAAPGSAAAQLKRAANSQKCIRAGGKHNDLEDVGRDFSHHTFFEMLGNWSFGDYFKDEAIAWAWELLTGPASAGGFELDPRRLHVTVFAGDASERLEPDEEAAMIWRRHLPADHISRWSKKDNFWEMGDTGPCGPCSEIHYDSTPDFSGARLVNRGDPRVLEIWNLVFIQFNRGEGGRLTALPARHVDTGMGLERLVRVLQHKDSNYDTDLFTPIFAMIRERTGARVYGGALEDPVDIAYRVIADHIRCLTAAITDGAVPSNEGRGYVLRRILRRAVRHARQTLAVQGPVLCDLLPAVVETLGGAFPDLTRDPARVAAVIRDEERGFLRTLDRGIAHFTEAGGRAVGARPAQIAAQDAFMLHDTYGFPIDLTRVMAEERGLAVDEAGYEKLMEEAREKSRRGSGGGGGPGGGGGGGGEAAIALPPEAIAKLKYLTVPPTDDRARDGLAPVSARVEAIWNGHDFDERADADRRVALVLNRTCLYAESGGQVGDRGQITFAGAPGRGAARFAVEDTRAFGGYVLHIGQITGGSLDVGDQVGVEVDGKARRPTMANHTATHLLNFALREVVGPEEDQKGSLVAPDRLRFDFACSRAMKADEIERAEAIVNQRIATGAAVHTAVMPYQDALRIAGLRAVFGEKYPGEVRVVAIGVRPEDARRDPSNERWKAFSIELCGGTHLADAREARRFVITHEQALAAGVRRITAVTGAAAEAAASAAAAFEKRLDAIESLTQDGLPAALNELSREVEAMTLGTVARHRIDARLEALRQRVRSAQKQAAAASQADLLDDARALASTARGPIIVEALGGTDRAALLSAMDLIRSRHEQSAVMLLGHDQENVTIVARVPDGLIQRGLRAGDWVKTAAEASGGKGGGRPDMAQAGGREPKKLPAAIAAARAYAERTLR